MKKTKGFTLVELIVVIAILAVLAILAVVAFRGMTEAARLSRINEDLRRVASHLNLVGSTMNTAAAQEARDEIAGGDPHAFCPIHTDEDDCPDECEARVAIVIGEESGDFVDDHLDLDDDTGMWTVDPVLTLE